MYFFDKAYNSVEHEHLVLWLQNFQNKSTFGRWFPKIPPSRWPPLADALVKNPKKNPDHDYAWNGWCIPKRFLFFESRLVGGWTDPSEKYAQVKLDHETPNFGIKTKILWNHHSDGVFTDNLARKETENNNCWVSYLWEVICHIATLFKKKSSP